jgi:hypothetical protein
MGIANQRVCNPVIGLPQDTTGWRHDHIDDEMFVFSQIGDRDPAAQDSVDLVAILVHDANAPSARRSSPGSLTARKCGETIYT